MIEDRYSKKIQYLPIILIEIYFIFTIIIFEFGPVKWNVNNKFTLYTFLIVYQIFLVFGYILGIKSKKHITRKISIDLKKYFTDELTYGETMKPKGQNISLIMERNNYQKAYYIGDTQKDKDACEFAKIPFVYASYGFGDVKDYDKKIDSFEELLNLF